MGRSAFRYSGRVDGSMIATYREHHLHGLSRAAGRHQRHFHVTSLRRPHRAHAALLLQPKWVLLEELAEVLALRFTQDQEEEFARAAECGQREKLLWCRNSERIWSSMPCTRSAACCYVSVAAVHAATGFLVILLLAPLCHTSTSLPL
jgi:hypothetical protein